jgi:hypothetical protein
MMVIPISPNRQLFITAKLWKTLANVYHGFSEDEAHCIGTQGLAKGMQAFNLLFPRAQLNVTRISSAKI